MARLRGEGGCPWDMRQTHRSLLPYLIEETSETADAIESGDVDALCEELGDVLLQIVFHSQIGKEHREFTIREVVEGIRDKLLRRHPHVFGSAHADTPDQVVVQWEEIKKDEKKGKRESRTHRSRSLEELKGAFPAADIDDEKGFSMHRLEMKLKEIEEELEDIRQRETLDRILLKKLDTLFVQCTLMVREEQE